MPEMSGMEVALHASGRANVVFITAYDQYAVKAFEHGALDYLQKPDLRGTPDIDGCSRERAPAHAAGRSARRR